MTAAASSTAPGEAAAGGAGALKWLRATLLFLVFFDLVIAVPALFFPHWILGLAKLNADGVAGAMYRSGAIEPMFLRGVGILWLVAAYVQYLAWRDPVGRLSAVNIALVFRFLGGSFELVEATLLLPRAGLSEPLVYGVLGVFVAGDYALVAFMILLLHRLRLKWW